MEFMLALAFLMRLALMPVSLHNDLLFVNYFPYFLSYHGVWEIYGSVGRHAIETNGAAYYAPLVYYTVGAWQALLKPFAPEFLELMDRIRIAQDTRSGAWLWEGFSRADILRLVATMKFPYLLTDVFCFFLIGRIQAARNIRKVQLLWAFHPALLFSVYVVGTYRIYTALLLWLAIYALERGKKTLSGLVLGVLCLADNFPWLLLIPSILVLGSGWKERARLLAVALLPFTALFIPLYFASDGYVVYAYASPVLAKAAAQSLTRHHALVVTGVAKIVFAAGYAALIGLLFLAKRAAALENAKRTRLFIHVNTAVLLLFYATSQTLAHYFMWVLPLFVLIQAEKEPWSPRLSWLAVALLFVFNLDTRSLNLGLLSPLLGERAFAYPSFHEWADRFFPWGPVVAASRLAFSALCLHFTWRLFDRRIRPVLEGRSA